MAWDPAAYLEYADERGRPFLDLLGRVPATEPAAVVDLGCGTGSLTRLLADRWPGADVVGVDSSPEMIERAEPTGRLRFEVADLATWAPDRPVDVVLSSAALQWVPGHLELLPRLLDELTPGGWLAFQVPGNFDQSSHTIRRALAAEAPYAEHLVGLPEPQAHDAATYLHALREHGCDVEAWETTYLHVLSGADPVLRWISGTSARPMLTALPEPLRQAFEDELRTRLRSAYPERGGAVVLPFRRVFVVARRAGAVPAGD